MSIIIVNSKLKHQFNSLKYCVKYVKHFLNFSSDTLRYMVISYKSVYDKSDKAFDNNKEINFMHGVIFSLQIFK